MIVNDLIVGIYEAQTKPSTVIGRVQIKKTHMWNESTGTIFLEQKDKKPHESFKSFYPGVSMIGKHFKLRSLFNKDVHRHYTLCNTMRPQMY